MIPQNVGCRNGDKRTVAKDFVSRESSSHSDSQWNPFSFHNEGSEDKEGGGDINPIDLVGGEGTGIGGDVSWQLKLQGRKGRH